MGAQLTFLGSAGDPLVVGQQQRASGGFVLKVDNVQLHVDPGPGAVIQALRHGVNPRETTAILVSHAHLGHTNDLNAVVSAMTHAGLDKRGVVVGHESALTDEVFRPYFKSCVERIIPLEVGKKVGIEHVDIMGLPMKHSVPGVGFKFMCNEFTLSYLSDTGYSKALADALLDTDILVMNVVDPSGHENDYQLTTDTAIKMITMVKPALAIIGHFGSKMLRADPIYEARKIQTATKVQTMAVKDGLTIDPVNATGIALSL